MNMLCFVFFIAVALAKDSLVIGLDKDKNGDPVNYIKVEFGKCYYFGSDSGAMKFSKDGDNIKMTAYAEEGCKGTNVETQITVDQLTQTLCALDTKSTCYGSIRKAPTHVAFISLVQDDETCSHRDDTVRVYVTDSCYKCLGDYCKAEEENGKMYLNTYANDQCTGDKKLHEEQFECDTCKEGVMYQCGAISTMVLSVVAILAFLL
ncbi:hypothetical protein EDI_199570 [Entamoeba dispar SAW760]|uniref:Uncharacterized protein n=1 Tax=Entamoeba dispar (strain ATCC PRA-260 / SAW760) TaxID=370354 RepID=B0EC25_ENTDS|nr:uncharacterized protein EDI_199570 [Entamoeba dispar SAW760]EDR27915.1 hypothetical protein EDI_199570 [Entamoeba dispar SAW760]|eukprot:EDR27915.1 hypothetical protein EDI_199570 [Entamoeba dispar SAW760]